MTELQEFCKMMLFEEKISDHQLSILLVDIMNAIGFSKCEREIHRHRVHLLNLLSNIFQISKNKTVTIAGSTSEGMCGGIFGNQSNHDNDFVFTATNIRLYTPGTNDFNNAPLICQNEDYGASFFVDEDVTFPGYVKLLLSEVKTNSFSFFRCTRMCDNKLYLSNSMIMDLMYEPLVKPSKKYNSFPCPRIFDQCQPSDINGPAHTSYTKDYREHTKQADNVFCIHYHMWPNSAKSFISRRKPNNWPSNSMLENIQRQGCDVAPVGHHDSNNNDIQWRISFPGERSLLLDLADIQILCYVLIKIILRENLNTSQREVVSSFHIKHVLFWCVERCSCQWVYSNYINCLNICLAKLIQMIKARHIPHYIIESRNLFNSKMTETMSTEIVDVLSKYDTTYVFTLDAFDGIFELTHYNNALLKRYALISTIIACFNIYFPAFTSYVYCTSGFWDLYIPHNATNSLRKQKTILQNWKKGKEVYIHYVTYLLSSMVGVLYYAKYKETKKADFLLASKRLIKKSLNLENSCVKLRAATFFLANLEYSQSIKICDTFLTFLPRHKIDSFDEYTNNIWKKVCQQLSKVKTTDEIENIMKTILPMFYNSDKLKSLPGSYDITEQNPVWIFRNFTNIFFHDLYIDVTFMTAEKWVVPEPILYELLSLRQAADNEESPFAGIHLNPKFASLQTKFLCYHSMGNVNNMAEMLTSMNSFITDTPCITQSSCAYLNMLAYCQIKAGQHRKSVKSILQSLLIFPSKYNTALGYLNIVIRILNSLSVSNC